MRKRLMLVGVGVVVLAICLSVASGASAATQVGDPCLANLNSPQPVPATIFSIAAPESPFPTTVPAAGVITSWGVNVGSALAAGAADAVTFKVMRPNLVTKTVQVVGEGNGVAVTGSNIFAARIPVQAGDTVGATDSGGSLLFCEEPSLGATMGLIAGNPVTGSTVAFTSGPEEKGQIPLFATVEPDADGDGFGDETQDQCPTDASTQGPCPAKVTPPAPPTLSASAAAKKTFLTVSLTSTAQTSVTVTGTVKVGKGKSVKLKGNTQTVTPGALAKFTVLFPAKMKAALKKLSTSKKLTVDLSASAPGATTKTLTVKVPGQKRPRHGGGHEQHHLM